MKRLRENQSGLASLVIAVIIAMILLTLVVGFSKLIRREQRRSLDRQLSSQAFYAAETGVNDAQKAINDGFTSTKDRCTPFPAVQGMPDSISGNSNLLTPDGTVSYSCLLINPTPDTLKFDNVKTGTSTIFPVQPSDGSAIGSITFAWQDTDKTVQTFKGVPNRSTDFVPENSWGNVTGMLRLDLVPIPSPTITRAGLISNARTYFLYPRTSGVGATTINYATSVSGEIVEAACNTSNTPSYCVVIVDGLPATSPKVYARVSAIYRPAVLTMAMTNITGTPVMFKDAQTLVDSTGKANNVMRRIQVRVPIFGDMSYPESILRSIDTLCKKFSVHVTPDDLTSDDPPDANCNPNP